MFSKSFHYVVPGYGRKQSTNLMAAARYESSFPVMSFVSDEVTMMTSSEMVLSPESAICKLKFTTQLKA
jgi:hypothetical protein